MSTNRLRTWLCAVASAAVLAGSAAIAAAASAQDTGRQISSDAAKAIHLSSAPKVAPVAPPAGLAINRPTIPMANYVAAKNAAAAQAPGRAKPGAAAPVNSKVTLYAQVPSTNETQTTGGNRLPPGGDIATSSEWMVQVNNDVIVMLNWFTNAFVQANLSTLFQNGTDFIFDPRVIYDPYWNRFVVVASRCTDCSNTASSESFLEIAVSQTGDPSAGWWLYSAAPTAGGLNDFPQLGMDLHSIIVTYNIFFYTGEHRGEIFAASKAYLYNGLPWDARLFDGGVCTIAPPYVLDNNGVDYLLQFCPGDNFVRIGSMRDTGLSTQSINLLDNPVNVKLNGVPPQAVQPAPNGAYTLDTGDNRFENRSLQVGSRIINTATIALDGFPVPAYYNFNIGVTPHTLVSEGAFRASPTSYDWHPAINANTVGASGTPLGEIFTTWMSTDPTNKVNVQLRAGGGLGDNPTIGSGIPVFTSSIGLTNQTDSNGIHRTGDYAYIALYPAAALGCTSAYELGILTGETAGPAAGLWGTHVAIVKHC